VADYLYPNHRSARIKQRSLGESGWPVGKSPSSRGKRPDDIGFRNRREAT